MANREELEDIPEALEVFEELESIINSRNLSQAESAAMWEDVRDRSSQWANTIRSEM